MADLEEGVRVVLVVFEEVKHTQPQHVEGEADMATVVKPVQHLHTHTTRERNNRHDADTHTHTPGPISAFHPLYRTFPAGAWPFAGQPINGKCTSTDTQDFTSDIFQWQE